MEDNINYKLCDNLVKLNDYAKHRILNFLCSHVSLKNKDTTIYNISFCKVSRYIYVFTNSICIIKLSFYTDKMRIFRVSDSFTVTITKNFIDDEIRCINIENIINES